MIPTFADYYIKAGKKLPNSSKNKNRQIPTVEKIKTSTVYHFEKIIF